MITVAQIGIVVKNETASQMPAMMIGIASNQAIARQNARSD